MKSWQLLLRSLLFSTIPPKSEQLPRVFFCKFFFSRSRPLSDGKKKRKLEILKYTGKIRTSKILYNTRQKYPQVWWGFSLKGWMKRWTLLSNWVEDMPIPITNNEACYRRRYLLWKLQNRKQSLMCRQIRSWNKCLRGTYGKLSDMELCLKMEEDMGPKRCKIALERTVKTSAQESSGMLKRWKRWCLFAMEIDEWR